MKQKSRIFAILAVFVLVFSLFSFSPTSAATDYNSCKSLTYTDSSGAKKTTSPICAATNSDGTFYDIGVNSMDGVTGGNSDISNKYFYYTIKGGKVIINYIDSAGVHKSPSFSFVLNEFEETDDYYTKWESLWGEIKTYIETNIPSLGNNNEYSYGSTSASTPVSGNSGSAASSNDNVNPNTVTGEKGNAVNETKLGIDPECNKTSALGWLACPLAESLASLAKNMYEKYVEPELLMETNYISSPTVSTVWGTFRDISNILLAVLILVVVISQVTGIGIDNYGIKKILPKIIVAALLINLSFFICQVAIDLSNIVGTGVMNLFAGIESGIEGSVNKGGTGASIAAVIGALIVGVIGIIALPGVILDIGTVISVIVGLLAFVISIFFLFLLLIVRKAGIIALVIVSPLAFALYMLPNTKNLFDKWVKFFSSLLLLFPICGLIMGASALIASLFSNNGDGGLHNGLIACVIAVAPVFLIPSVVRSSFAVFGKVGSTIAGFGQRLSTGFSRTANRTVRDSQKFKEIQGNQNRQREAAYAERRLTALNRTAGNLAAQEKSGKPLTDRQKKRLETSRLRAARLQSVLNRQTAENIEAKAGVKPINEAALLARAQSKRSAEELEAEISVMKEDTSNYDVDVMSDNLRTLLTSNDPLDASQQIRAKALMKKLATSGGYGQKNLSSVLGKASDANRSFAAGFMSKDSDVASAIAKKNGAMAQYLRDVNVGRKVQHNGSAVASSELSFADWNKAFRLNDDGSVSADTNMKFVIDNVLTDDKDFAGQSAGVVLDQLNTPGIISDDRLIRIASNDLLMKNIDGDVRTNIENAMKSRGLTIPSASQEIRVVSSGNYVSRSNPSASPIRINVMSDGTYVNAGTNTPISAADMSDYHTEEHATQEQILNINHGGIPPTPPVPPTPTPTPAPTPTPPSAAPTIIGEALYRPKIITNPSAPPVRIRQMSDGTYINTSTGEVIDINLFDRT